MEKLKNTLLLRQDKEFGLVVVDLAKDPLAAGPLARSTTRNSNLDQALASCLMPSGDEYQPSDEKSEQRLRL
jgi:hypothetical protein